MPCVACCSAICKRKMQGNYNNGRAHYRCRIRADYVLGDQLPHPKAVYVREDRLVEPLDRWLLQLFDTDNADATIDALTDAAGDATHDARVKAAREAMAAHETKIMNYRDAFDRGSTPRSSPAGSRARGRENQGSTPARRAQPPEGLSRDDIAAMGGSLAEVVTLLQRAEPEHKMVVYQHLGVRLTYQHDQGLAADRWPLTWAL